MSKKTQDQKIIVVVCGDSTLGTGGKAHCSICYGTDMAAKERAQMERSGYPVKGVFEVNTVNIFHRIPYYLGGDKEGQNQVNLYL
jgi:hypothetical protein